MLNYKELYKKLEAGKFEEVKLELKDKSSKLEFLKYQDEADNNNSPLHLVFENPTKEQVEFFRSDLDLNEFKGLLSLLNDGGYNPLGKVMSNDNPKEALETILSSFKSEAAKSAILMSIDEDKENILHWIADEDAEDLDQDLLDFVIESARENNCFDEIISQERVSGDSPLHFAIDGKADVVLHKILDAAESNGSLDAVFTAKGENNNTVLHVLDELSAEIKTKLFKLLPQERALEFLSSKNNGDYTAIEKMFNGQNFVSFFNGLADVTKNVITESLLENVFTPSFVGDLDESEVADYNSALSAFYANLDDAQKSLVLSKIDLTKRENTQGVFTKEIIEEKESIEKSALLNSINSAESLAEAATEAENKGIDAKSEITAKLSSMKSNAVDSIKNANEEEFNAAVEKALSDAEVLKSLDEEFMQSVKAQITSSIDGFVGAADYANISDANAFVAKINGFNATYSEYVSNSVSELKIAAEAYVAKQTLLNSIDSAESLAKAATEAENKGIDIKSEVTAKLSSMKSNAVDSIKNANEAEFNAAVEKALSDAEVLKSLDAEFVSSVKSQITSSIDGFVGAADYANLSDAEAFVAKINGFNATYPEYVSNSVSELKIAAEAYVEKNSFTAEDLEKITKAVFLVEKHKNIAEKIKSADSEGKKDFETAQAICKEMKINSDIAQDIELTYTKVFSGDSLGKFYGKCSGESRAPKFFEKSLNADSKIATNVADAEKVANEFARCDTDGCAKSLIEEKGICAESSQFFNTTDCKYIVGGVSAVLHDDVT